MRLTKSNREKHFLYAIPIGLVFTILCIIGIATILGGLGGQVLQLLLILIFI